MASASRMRWVGAVRDEPGPCEDRDLVAQARHDPTAFGLLYDRYADRVYRYCLRRLGDREAAEDATSVVFTRALAALPRFLDHGRNESFRAWLFTIAHHVIASSYRDARHDQPLETAQDVPDPAHDASPEDIVLNGERARSLQSVLAQLSPDQRRVIELRLAGLTGDEIGRVLGRSRNAVGATQFRAVARLRRLLGTHTDTKEEQRERR